MGYSQVALTAVWLERSTATEYVVGSIPQNDWTSYMEMMIKFCYRGVIDDNQIPIPYLIDVRRINLKSLILIMKWFIIVI